MTKLRVHALFEHGVDLHPYCSGHLRLLRPLSHPSVRDRVELTASRRYDARPHDIVIVERLWVPFVTLETARRLIEQVRRAKAKLVYALDDNLFDLRMHLAGQSWMTQQHVEVLELFSRASDAILVTTERLRARVAQYNDRVFVIANALDERLICARTRDRELRIRGPVVIGYMGTRNHDEDLEMVAPALKQIHNRWGNRVAFEIIGAVADPATLERLGDLPLRVVQPPVSYADYPLFFTWYTRTVNWDIAIAPLRANVFNICKSDIKLLDYAAIGAAGVYSNVPPYDSVVDGELGLIAGNDADSWVAAVERLILDSGLRARLADNASDYVFNQRTFAQCAGEWADALHSLMS